MSQPSGAWAKLRRAQAHADAFDEAVAAYFTRRSIEMRIHMEDEPPNWLVVSWVVHEAPPPDLALIFGDMLGNLRSALDYLVCELLVDNNRQPNNRTAFPCVRRAQDWPSVVNDRLLGVPGRWAAEIEKLQPYHGGSADDRHLFNVLDRLNNTNKHQLLPSRILTAQYWQPTIEGDLGGRKMSFNFDLEHPIVDGAEMARWSFEPPLPTQQIAITEPLFRISFDDGLDHGDGWSYTNRDLINWTETALGVFELAQS